MLGTCDGCGAVVPIETLSLTTFPELEGFSCEECKRDTIVAPSPHDEKVS